MLPSLELFRDACVRGLSVVRPLKKSVALSRDDQGWNYGSAPVPSYEAYGRMRALITLQEARALRPRRVLEVAAGDAALAACLAADGAEVIVNDLRAVELENSIAAFTNSETIQILPGDLFKLSPTTTGLFDLVIAAEVIEHVAHVPEMLNHLKSFLTPNGSLLITTPNGEYFRNTLPTYFEIKNYSDLESRQFQPDADGHLFLITVRELSRMAADAGLSISELRFWGSPFITGQAGARVLRRVAPLKILYDMERVCHKSRFSRRVCYSILAVLRPKEPYTTKTSK